MGPTFNQPFKITFTGHGHYLLCGYVQGDFSTFARGELRGVVAADPTTAPPPATTPPPSSTTPPSSTSPTAAIPAVVRRPWITRKRHVLTCHAGTWSHKPTSRRYRWSVKGHSKKLAAGRKLRVRRSPRGRKVVCRVTARNAAGSRTASSRALCAR